MFLKMLLFLLIFITNSYSSVKYDKTANLLSGYIDVAMYASALGVVVAFIVLIISAFSIIRFLKRAGYSVHMKF